MSIAAYMYFKSVDKTLAFKLKLLGSSLHVLSCAYCLLKVVQTFTVSLQIKPQFIIWQTSPR